MKIVGTVVDNEGNTLPGANVYVSDINGDPFVPTVGTSTDADGRFELDMEPGDFITVSFIGYKPVTTDAIQGVMYFSLFPASYELPVAEVVADKIRTEPVILQRAGLALLAGLLFLAVIKKSK